ncbi:hypothetical protein G7077_02785 [Sphingomonas piscis]|uniref:Uncharacterized protein n=1 Tax=Sphingomonas piscis TaxID=2714943 RepID=A0A6G7YMQ1_9SPHN|nr:hypothetical protein [Sphingomonas piscis]QIK77996.1 hypothetical protein G7077_02785 [Sphingomonas piscis]
MAERLLSTHSGGSPKVCNRPIADIQVCRQIVEMRSLKSLPLCVLAAVLSGCSYTYNLSAVVIDGRLAFVVDQTFLRSPDCIRGIEVSLDTDGPNPQLESGDDASKIRNGVYWSQRMETGSCLNDFPVLYGSQLKGTPFVFSDGESGIVMPKKLRVGVIYQVHTESSGSGYGSGWFRITPQLTVESWREDPTPQGDYS